jgi:hypothetical protein
MPDLGGGAASVLGPGEKRWRQIPIRRRPMLTSQGKAGKHPVPRGEDKEDKAVAWTELRGNPGEDNREAADEVHIPDYVMYDFGFHRRIRCDR